MRESLVTAMDRMAAGTGQVITYDQALNWEHEMGPNTDKLTLEVDSPLMPDAEGTYRSGWAEDSVPPWNT